MTSLQVLPFYNFNDRQSKFFNGLWSVQFNQLIDIDLLNLIPNPDESDEIDPDLMLTIPMVNYYSISPINNSISKADRKPFQCFTVI